MKRTQLQLEEATYEQLRSRAYSRGVSMASVIREALAEYLAPGSPRPRAMHDFSFIGSGRSEESALEPISERHDEVLAEDVAE
jgi:hypothetical protein